MEFSRNAGEEKVVRRRFGKNIIVTDNMEWSTEEIYTAYLDRNNLEQEFGKSKSHCQTAMMPSYHWTDNMFPNGQDVHGLLDKRGI